MCESMKTREQVRRRAGGFRAQSVDQNSEMLQRSEQRDTHSFKVSKDKNQKEGTYAYHLKKIL